MPEEKKEEKKISLAEQLANIEEARRQRQAKRELQAAARKEKRIARRKKRRDNRSGGSSVAGLKGFGGTRASRVGSGSIGKTKKA
jgi:hypothetical protein